MLRWAFVSLILAIVFGVLGYSGLAGAFAWISLILFSVLLIIAVVPFVMARRLASRIT